LKVGRIGRKKMHRPTLFRVATPSRGFEARPAAPAKIDRPVKHPSNDDEIEDAMSQDQLPDAADPFLEELLDAVLKPHASLPPEILAEMRATLRAIAVAHPVGSALVDAARPRKAPERSGDELAPGAQAAAEQAPPVCKKQGGA
jgi:hypothetical protein